VTLYTRLVPVVLFAASVSAFVASGLYSDGGNRERPPARVGTPPHDYATERCEDLREGCTIGQSPYTGQVIIEFRQRP
jgi:hypothetical protein